MLEGFGAPEPRGSFGFVQLEFPFALGPADGRYLSRPAADGEVDFIIALRTLGAPPRRRGPRRRRPRPVRDPGPASVPVVRATVVRALPIGAEDEAKAWLARLRRDRDRLDAEVAGAVRALNRLVRAHRAAAEDPYARDVSRERALAVRVGHGSGSQVADGRFAAAYELPPERRRERRAQRLSPQERLASIVGAREPELAADELVLRARADLDAGRAREAALQARIALECVLEELPAEPLGAVREELERDRDPVSEAASAALSGEPPAELAAKVVQAVSRMERALRRHRAVDRA